MKRGDGRAICVYCASSRSCRSRYHDAARELGVVLAEQGYGIVYGGGAVGSMGALADGALSVGGRVIGVLPRFMDELEWGHPRITKLELVDDMRTRKHRMLAQSHGVVALPGGSGTLEELFETITLKRLGLYLDPIILVNTDGFFDRLVEMLEHCIDEQFMSARHRDMWQVVAHPQDVPQALDQAPPWTPDARNFAAV